VDRRRLKYVALILLLGGLALVAYNLLRRRPVEYTIEVRFGRAKRDLQRAALEVYRSSDDVLVQRKGWSYQNHAVPESETAKLKMAKGKYRFTIRLEWPAAVKSDERVVRVSENDVLLMDVSHLAP